MTVGELKEELENYGDHLEVWVEVYKEGEEEKHFSDIVVDDANFSMEPVVLLTVEDTA